jgi:hypothetical protein
MSSESRCMCIVVGTNNSVTATLHHYTMLCSLSHQFEPLAQRIAKNIRQLVDVAQDDIIREWKVVDIQRAKHRASPSKHNILVHSKCVRTTMDACGRGGVDGGERLPTTPMTTRTTYLHLED